MSLRSLRRFAPLLALFLACACSALPDSVQADSPPPLWRVASDLDNPPFAFVDEAGVPQGRDVDMTRELARALDVSLVWDRMPFDELLDALEAGEVDAVVATLGATPERAERVLLSTPYYLTSLRVLVRRGDGEPQDLRALAGKRVAAGVGTTSEAALRERLPEAVEAEPSAKGASSLERLLTGEVDALVMDGPDALDFARERPGEVVVLPEALAEERYVIAVRPGAEAWLARLDAELDALLGRGWLDELDRRFGLPPSAR